jgi:hypothetical protein
MESQPWPSSQSMYRFRPDCCWAGTPAPGGRFDCLVAGAAAPGGREDDGTAGEYRFALGGGEVACEYRLLVPLPVPVLWGVVDDGLFERGTRRTGSDADALPAADAVSLVYPPRPRSVDCARG